MRKGRVVAMLAAGAAAVAGALHLKKRRSDSADTASSDSMPKSNAKSAPTMGKKSPATA
jgi:hypothetical protein